MRFALTFVLAACGGTVSSPGPTDPAPASTNAPAPAPSNPQAMSCAATPTDWRQACTYGRDAFRVEATSVDFATRVVHVRYHNFSSTASWEYPQARITTDDERVAPIKESPTLYALGTCATHDTDLGLMTSAPIPSGTKVHFTFTPVITNGTGTCDGTPTGLDAIVP